MTLLERESHLAELHRALAQAGDRRGRTILVTGEAGIGKSSLVDAFTRAIEPDARVLWGACEAMFTPRPLGPFHDIVHALGGPLRVQLQNDGRPIDLFHGLLEHIRRDDRPTVIVLEDVHWADHASLDFIRFLARRIERVQALFVLTYRADEVGPEHPLTAVLGELPAAGKLRLELDTLSRSSVESLARDAGRASGELYRITGGNPFFVTEVLREGTGRIAPSVREAVLSRARHLPEPARRILDLASVVPEKLELPLLRLAHGPDLEPLHACLDRGLLVLDAEKVSFRHELARIAVEDALPPLRRADLHGRILAALARDAPDADTLNRLAHHAVSAGDGAAIVRYIPDAARVATRRGSHREAFALLTAAVPHAELLAPRERAQFFDQRSRACFLIEQGAEAFAMNDAAHRLWDAIGDEFAKGCNLMRRAELIWMLRLTDENDSARVARESVRLLEKFPPADELALAYSASAVLLADSDHNAAANYRAKALALAEESPTSLTRVEVLSWIGTAELISLGAPTLENVDRLWREASAAGNDPGLLSAWLKRAQYNLRERNLAVLAQSVEAGLGVARGPPRHPVSRPMLQTRV